MNLYSILDRTTLILATLAVFLSGIALVGDASARQTEQEIRDMLIERDQEMKRLLGASGDLAPEKREALRDVINGVIDFRAMGKATLGSHWANLSEAQQSKFVDVFSEIVRRQSLSNLDVYRSKVSYESITVNGSTARAVTTTTYKDVPATVEYDMIYRDGDWYVSDIILDDVGTVEGFARSFQAVIRKKGFDSLMTSLNKKLDTQTTE